MCVKQWRLLERFEQSWSRTPRSLRFLCWEDYQLTGNSFIWTFWRRITRSWLLLCTFLFVNHVQSKQFELVFLSLWQSVTSEERQIETTSWLEQMNTSALKNNHLRNEEKCNQVEKPTTNEKKKEECFFYCEKKEISSSRSSAMTRERTWLLVKTNANWIISSEKTNGWFC